MDNNDTDLGSSSGCYQRMPEWTSDLSATWPMRLAGSGFMICLWLIFITFLFGGGNGSESGYKSPQEDAISCYPADMRPAMLATYRAEQAAEKAKESEGNMLVYIIGSIIFGLWAFLFWDYECMDRGPMNGFHTAKQMALVLVPVLAVLYCARGIVIPLLLLPLCLGVWLVGKLRIFN